MPHSSLIRHNKVLGDLLFHARTLVHGPRFVAWLSPVCLGGHELELTSLLERAGARVNVCRASAWSPRRPAGLWRSNRFSPIVSGKEQQDSVRRRPLVQVPECPGPQLGFQSQVQVHGPVNKKANRRSRNAHLGLRCSAGVLKITLRVLLPPPSLGAPGGLPHSLLSSVPQVSVTCVTSPAALEHWSPCSVLS